VINRDWAPAPYSVETMGLEMFRQARWLAVYGTSIASQVQAKIDEGNGAPDESDVARFAEEAATLANMVAVANGEPER
jgi:hypothetical protein